MNPSPSTGEVVTHAIETAPPAKRRAARGGIPWGRFATIGFFLVFYLIVGLVGSWSFLSQNNITNVLGQNSQTAFAAAAITITLIAGQFDLSVGALLGLCAVLTAGLSANQGLNPLIVVGIIVVIGILTGLLNSFLVTRLKVNAFIATLGTGTAFGGIALLYTGGQLIYSGISPALTDPMRVKVLGFPLVILLPLLLLLILWVLTKRMVFGRYLYATGANPTAAGLAGVPVRRVTTAAFVSTGVIAAIGGIVMTGTIGSANPTSGPELLLPAFAAAFLGSSLMGSESFSVVGSIIATFLLGLALNGLDIMGLSAGAKPIFNGVVLIAAVALSQALRSRKRKTRVFL